MNRPKQLTNCAYALSTLTEETSIKILEQVRWPQGLACPRCAERAVTKFSAVSKGRKKRHLYQCSDCRYQYSVTVGTIFQDSHIPLNKWFGAIWLLSIETRKPSVRAMHSTLDLPYKTVWKMSKRITESKTPEENEPETDLTNAQILPATYDFGRSRPLSGQIGPLGIDIIGHRLQRILGPPGLVPGRH
jgi:transposase-like protein